MSLVQNGNASSPSLANPKKMSTDVSTHQQIDIDTVNGHLADSRFSEKASFEDIVQSSELFWKELQALHKSSGKTVKVPTIGRHDLDLHRLFVEVTSRGGIEKVIKQRKWKEVVAAFKFPTTITSASFVLRKYYLSLLYRFEKVHFVKKQASPVLSTDEATKTGSSYAEEGDPEIYVGCTVAGVIDGKFDSGYLVTMKLGSEELKGILYHVPKTPYPSQNLDTRSEPSKRQKKRPRLASLDSARPKCHRSGYNFFFAEQYARLKLEYHGQERSLTKTIGHMWSTMLESEKQVYQERGMKDVERYRTEMSEYKSTL